MRNVLKVLLVLPLLLLLTSCGEKEEPKETKQQQMNMNELPTATMHTVKVEEKMDANNYTYLNVSENGKTYWIAVSQMDVKPGEMITYSKFMEMKDFKSETLNRTFPLILFVDDAHVGTGNNQLATQHSNLAAPIDPAIKVEPLKDGYTIESVYSKKTSLLNKTIKVKGIVVKVNENIMGVNWIHIQDGTGKESSHDLLVTSSQSAKKGQTIVAEGKVVTDKDFGSGYFYPVLLEDSKITVQ